MQQVPYLVGHDLSGDGAPDDAELMLRIQRGDASSMRVLIHRYWVRLVRYAARIVGSTDSAEDMVQQAFVTVWSERVRYRQRGTPQAYLYRIVRNEALQECRRQEVRGRRVSDVVRPARPATPLDDTMGHELDEALQEALGQLPDRRREAFVLARYHGLSLNEIGQVMRISPQTVANHVSLAMAELRRALARFLA